MGKEGDRWQASDEPLQRFDLGPPAGDVHLHGGGAGPLGPPGPGRAQRAHDGEGRETAVLLRWTEEVAALI